MIAASAKSLSEDKMELKSSVTTSLLNKLISLATPPLSQSPFLTVSLNLFSETADPKPTSLTLKAYKSF